MKNREFVELMLRYIKAGIERRILPIGEEREIEWSRVYRAAKKNMLLPLLYPQIAGIHKEGRIPEDIFCEWKKHTQAQMLSECEKYRILRGVLNKSREQGIVCIVIKGCILADLYPQYQMRASHDTDILIRPEDLSGISGILSEMGFFRDKKDMGEKVRVYFHPETGSLMEVHLSLWEDYTGERINKLEQMSLTAKESLIAMNVCHMEITTLGYREHLIYQMFHIIKHFTLQGVSLRYLADITLYIDTYGRFIDFNDFWSKMDHLGYGMFCENFFCICTEYLGMKNEILKGRNLRITKNKERLIMDFIDIGDDSEEGRQAWQLMGILTPYLTQEQELAKPGFRRKIEILYPKARNLPEKYTYGRRNCLLLPLAWHHRMADYLIRRFKQKAHGKGQYRMKEKLKLAEQRLELIRELGLIDGEKSGENEDEKNLFVFEE